MEVKNGHLPIQRLYLVGLGLGMWPCRALSNEEHGTVQNPLPKEAEDLSTRYLIQVADGDRPCYNNENVENDAEYGDTKDGDVDTQRYLDRAQPSSKSVVCSINGSDSTTT